MKNFCCTALNFADLQFSLMFNQYYKFDFRPLLYEVSIGMAIKVFIGYLEETPNK
jgi:hypothetical protein